jgi:hypothetical protein
MMLARLEGSNSSILCNKFKTAVDNSNPHNFKTLGKSLRIIDALKRSSADEGHSQSGTPVNIIANETPRLQTSTFLPS